jgi:hypothetical protein
MHLRSRVLALLAINGLLMLAISWRFVTLQAAWEGWTTRQETRQLLHRSRTP